VVGLSFWVLVLTIFPNCHSPTVYRSLKPLFNRFHLFLMVMDGEGGKRSGRWWWAGNNASQKRQWGGYQTVMGQNQIFTVIFNPISR
jgi:hypothetical protein